MPRHISVAIDKFKYKLLYAAIFGGITSMNTAQFTQLNGYSNLFWGWGGEDKSCKFVAQLSQLISAFSERLLAQLSTGFS